MLRAMHGLLPLLPQRAHIVRAQIICTQTFPFQRQLDVT
jgi:hypothetical protein